MTPPERPSAIDVLVAVVLIVGGIALSMTLVLLFIGAPMVMAGVEMLTSPG